MFKSICSWFVLVLAGTLIDATPWVAEPRDATWLKHHQRLVNMTKEHAKEVKAVFLGASIIERWTQNGLEVWNEHYKNRHAYNYGIGGDRTEHVLWRIENGELDHVDPKVIVMMVGSNNINIKDKPADIAKGIKAITDLLHKQMPHAKVLLLSIFPRGGHEADTQVSEINKLVAHFDDQSRIFYLDVTEDYETSIGHLKPHLYTDDHVHLLTSGYKIWYKVMEPLFEKLSK